MLKTFFALGLAVTALSQQYNGSPVVTRNANTYSHVGFNNKLYTFSLPSLDLTDTFTADPSVTFYDPALASGNSVIMSDEENPGTYTVDVDTNTFSYQPTVPHPLAQFPSATDSNTEQTDEQGNVYTFTFDGTQSTVFKTSNGAVQSLSLPKIYNSKGVFTLQNGILYFTATKFIQRGSVNYDYYAVETSSFSIVDGPVELPNTATAGCPTVPRNCAVPVLDHLSIVDGLVVYVFTQASGSQGPFSAQINSYQKSCGISSNSWNDLSNPSSSGTGSCTNPGNSGTSVPQTLPPFDNSDPESTCTPNGCAGAKCCAGQCFSDAHYTCYTRTDGSKQLCPLGLSICGSACYNPTAYSCANNQLL